MICFTIVVGAHIITYGGDIPRISIKVAQTAPRKQGKIHSVPIIYQFIYIQTTIYL